MSIGLINVKLRIENVASKLPHDIAICHNIKLKFDRNARHRTCNPPLSSGFAAL